MKRFVSIDLLRGIAILGMIALHIFIVVFNTNVLVNAFQKGQGSIVLVVVAVIIAYFSSFAGLFFVISAISHIASMWRQYERAEEKTPKVMNKILKGQIYRGLILFGIGYFIEAIFWPYVAAVIPDLMVGKSFSGFWSQMDFCSNALGKSIRIITGREKHAKDRLDPQETLYNITPLGQDEQVEQVVEPN